MRLSKKKLILFFILLVSDSAVLILASILAFYLRFFVFDTYFISQYIDSHFISRYLSALNFMLPLWLIIVNFTKAYKHFFVQRMDEVVRTIKTVSVFILSCIVLSFIFKADYSRTVFAFVWINLIIFMYIARQLLENFIAYILRLTNRRNNILMIGKQAKKYRDIFKDNPINKVFYYPLILQMNDVQKIKTLILKKEIKQIIIVDHNMTDSELLSFYDWAEFNDILFKILPSEVQICRGEIIVDSILGVPVFQFISNSLTGFDYFLKRFFDICISFMLLLVLSPFLTILIILIKIDSKGNVIYIQKRKGYRGKIFDFYKFRSMLVDADMQLQKMKEQNPDAKTVFFKMKDDPRITRVGKFIRKYSIDELPQLFNVLKGDMSLVGPRPMLVHEEKLLKYNNVVGFKKSFRVMPGITGLWQVSGRSLLSDEKRIELDIFYVEHWTFAMDLKILFKTVLVVLTSKGSF